MGKQVLVTGGAGFIGRRLTESLAERGYSVTVLDNFKLGDLSLFPQHLQDKVEWVRGDVRQTQLVFDLVSEKDVVIHLASGSSFFMYEEAPIDETAATIVGFLNILEAMKHSGVGKVVYTSTSAVYEGNEVPYVENMSLEPPDLKALSKKINEEMAHLYSKRYGIKAIGLRPFSVYGDEEMSKAGYANVISLFAWAMLQGHRPIVWGDGTQTRDFIFVDDVVEAIHLALEGDLDTREFNVGTGVETSFNDVTRLLNEYLGTDLTSEYVPVPIPIYAHRLLADTSLAERVLGFKARVGIVEGIHHVVDRARLLIGTIGKEMNLGDMQAQFKKPQQEPKRTR